MSLGPTIPSSSRALYARLLREHLRPYVKWLGLAVVFMVLAALAQAFSAWLMKPVVDDIFVQRNDDLLILVASAVLATFVVKAGASYVQAVLMTKVGQRVVADLQLRMYKHLLTLDLDFFAKSDSGDFVSRFTNDTILVQNTVTGVLTSIGKDTLLLIALIAVIINADWMLGIICSLVFPIAFYPVFKFGQRMRKVARSTQAQRSDLLSFLSETIRGIRHLKAYGMEPHETGRMKLLIDRLFKLLFKAGRVGAAPSAIMEALAGAAIAAVIVFGGYRVISGAATAGDFFSFIAAALMVYEPAKRLSKVNILLQTSLASIERIYQILDQVPTILEAPDAHALRVNGAAIRLDNVRFSYEGDAQALDGVSLDIPAGKTVALVGPSGAGKTTVLNLVPRFYDVNEGTVAIDGQDIRGVTLESLRKTTALVSQDVVLFNDTVRANIAYGKPDATDHEIENAARHAAAHDFISDLPNGYDTMVGEGGVKLSGGQRQRLTIARAMLKDAPVLLLDEATSALDTGSERAVQAALGELMEGRTTVVIAHRLSTIADADLIYVFDKGRVVEHGNHDDLIGKNGLYARLHALQFADTAVNGNGG